MWPYVFESLSLYKVTPHVSLMTALIMSFICHLSWTSTSVEMCLNLWTFNKDFCVSRARSVLWLAVRRWCHIFMCTCSVNSGSSLSWQRKLMIIFMVPIKTDCIGLVLSTLNLSITLNLFIYIHGTGPQPLLMSMTSDLKLQIFPIKYYKLYLWLYLFAQLQPLKTGDCVYKLL